MSNSNRWAFDFQCDQSLDDICSTFNASGPWQWDVRENYVFGDYLNSRPEEGLRLRVHFFPQGFAQNKSGFSALLELEANSPLTQSAVDGAFRKLLAQVQARKIKAVEPYD